MYDSRYFQPDALTNKGFNYLCFGQIITYKCKYVRKRWTRVKHPGEFFKHGS